MNEILAQRIIKEVNKFSKVKIAITDEVGQVLSRSKNFNILHNHLDTQSKKSFPIKYHGQTFGHIFIDEDIEKIKKFGKIIQSMAELIFQQNRFSEIITSKEKRADQIIYDLFYNNSIENEEAKRVLKSLDINLEINRIAIILEISDSPNSIFNESELYQDERLREATRIRREIELILSSFYSSHRDDLVFYIGGKKFLILKDMGEKPKEYQEDFQKTINTLFYNLKDGIRTSITIGVGNFYYGIEGLKKSFFEAKSALKIGKQTWGENKIFHYDSFGVIAPLFANVSNNKIPFSNKKISNIKKDKNLFKTLKSFLNNNLSLSKTAQELKIHRNTLIYRLEKIEELSDLNPKNFEDAFQLYIGIILEDYYEK